MSKNIPEQYIPFEDIWVCGNTFSNGNVLFEVDGNPVFLIGKNNQSEQKFRVWLNAPSNVGGKPVWKAVIKNNEVFNKNYKVSASDFGQEVSFNGLPIIQFRLTGTKLIINLINMHPIGLNIVGGVNSLSVSGNELKNNSFNKVSTMVGIGK